MLFGQENQQAQQAPTAPNAGAAPQAPGADQQRRTEVPQAAALQSMLMRNRISASLDGKGEQYLTEVNKLVKKRDEGHKIEIREFNAPSRAQAYIHGNMAIILIFDELIEEIRDERAKVSLPRSAATIETARAFSQFVGSDKTILNIILVVKEDYDRPQQMAHHLVTSLFQSVNANSGLTFSHFLDPSLKYGIEQNPARVMKNHSDASPHGVAPRIDCGFTIYLEIRDPMTGAIQPHPMATVTAYTEFFKQGGFGTYGNAPRQKFQPLVHITDVITDLPTSSILTVLMPLAADILIKRGGWLAPYTTFIEGNPNLGNLFIVPETGQPHSLKSMPELHAFVAECMEWPLLVLDVVEGRARIPGIEMWVQADVTMQAAVIAEMNSFLGADLPVQNVCTKIHPEFHGDATIGRSDGTSSQEDIRVVDYFSVLKVDVGLAQERFLRPMYSNLERVQLVESLHKNVRVLYLNQHGVVSPTLMVELMKYIAQLPAAKGIMDANQSLVSISGLTNMSQQFAQGMQQAQSFGSRGGSGYRSSYGAYGGYDPNYGRGGAGCY